MPGNCSDKRVVVRAPSAPEWGPQHFGVGVDEHGMVPVMNLTWKLKSDGK